MTSLPDTFDENFNNKLSIKNKVVIGLLMTWTPFSIIFYWNFFPQEVATKNEFTHFATFYTRKGCFKRRKKKNIRELAKVFSQSSLSLSILFGECPFSIHQNFSISQTWKLWIISRQMLKLSQHSYDNMCSAPMHRLHLHFIFDINK